MAQFFLQYLYIHKCTHVQDHYQTHTPTGWPQNSTFVQAAAGQWGGEDERADISSHQNSYPTEIRQKFSITTQEKKTTFSPKKVNANDST